MSNWSYSFELGGSFVFLGHDYDHVFKNIRNNWFTEPNKELSFTVDGKEYIAYWKDVIHCRW